MATQNTPAARQPVADSATYKPIADYGVIGDMHTAVLIGSDGSIDWGCLPHFDSPAMFVRLLDYRKGGFCSLEVASCETTSRRYLGPTNILETTFVAAGGRLILTDFMPVQKRQGTDPDGRDVSADHRVIRLLRCTEGAVDAKLTVKPTFSFASEAAKVRHGEDGIAVFEGRNDVLQVQCPGLAVQDNGQAVSQIRIRAGQQVCVVLSYGTPGTAVRLWALDDALKAFQQTEQYWTEWSQSFHYDGEYRDEVLRSSLLLKLLTFEPTGAIVAAPTSSLPEAIPGERNWDYRFSWLRDSQFVITALMHRGYFGEAHDFFHFLKEASKGPVDDLQILYGIRGERIQTEQLLDYLDGYRGSKPVRVGNAAGAQKQLDVYGELLNCMYAYSNMAVEAEKKPHAEELWSMVSPLADYVVQHWREPDNGIWESRGGLRHFVHSKAMCWVALDRAIKLASVMSAPGNVSAWGNQRDAIRESVFTEGFNAEAGAFVQSYGSHMLDASVLRMPIHGMIGAADPRMLSTIRRIERQLMKNGLVYRYVDIGDNIPGDEATFTTCTFWLVNNYVLLDRLEEAKELFEHVLSFQNDLGLFAEEIEPVSREQLGNFPQALTHVGLISSAGRMARWHQEKSNGAQPARTDPR
jgi:GH15 family glucan-1,4-alpha-glucosidase